MKKIVPLVAVLSVCYSLSSNAANWDNNTALMLATASECAYAVKRRDDGKNEDKDRADVLDCLNDAARRNPKVLEAFSGLKDEAVKTFSDGKSLAHQNDEINAAILVKIPKGVIIAFRGTEASIWDWLNNFELTNINNISRNQLYHNGRHKGFDDSLKSLHGAIIKDKKIWQPFIGDQSDKSLFITGHSKGGALATGATVDFRSDFKGELVTYTFEAPRFFTADGATENRESLENLWRFEYQHDLVPHVPLGKITYDLLLKEENQKYIAVLAWIFNFPPDWKSRVERNNINFVPVGKLMYVEDNKQQIRQSDYENRFIATLIETGKHLIRFDAKEFVIEQHSKRYISYLEKQATGDARVAIAE